MGQTADQLRQEIDAKREDAASKIDQIEARVTDTAQQAKETVDQTVQNALGTVTKTVDHARDAVSGTVDQVKQAIDLKKMAEERPLLALGAALVGGFLLGGLTGGDDRHRSGSGGQQDQYGGNGGSTGHQGGRASGLRGAAQQSGLDETIAVIGGTLMGMVSERLRSTVKESFPEFEDRMRQHSEQQQQQRYPVATGGETQGGGGEAGMGGPRPSDSHRADTDASHAPSWQTGGEGGSGPANRSAPSGETLGWGPASSGAGSGRSQDQGS